MIQRKVNLRVLSAVLVFSFLVTVFPMQSMASNLNSDLKIQAQRMMIENSKEGENLAVTQVSKDLRLMKENFCDISNMSIYSTENDGTIIYKQEILDDVVDYIDVKEGNDGSVYLHFVEGNLENTVRFAPDDSVYIDGGKVEFVFDTIKSNNVIQPKAGARHTWQDSVPHNTYSWEYNGYSSVYQSSGRLEFEKEYGGYAVGALASVLCYKAKLGIKPSIAVGFIANKAFNELADWLISKHPGSRYASFQQIRTSRPKDSLIYHYQHKIEVYGMKDYQGRSTTLDTFYEVVQPT